MITFYLIFFVTMNIVHFTSSFTTSRLKGTTSLTRLNAYDAGETWHRIIERKKVEVESLLRQARAVENHPLYVRMGYMANANHFNLTRAIKRSDEIKDKGNYQTLSVICDMKRRSPTVPEKREIVDFDDAGKFSGLLVRAGIDALMVNTNEVEYGGHLDDIRKSFVSVRANRPHRSTPIIAKDAIIHPIQIAQAVELGASAVLIIAAMVGNQLETLLDSCTIMGIEALVEVHTEKEVEKAFRLGANLFLVNQWDRLTGKFYSGQANKLSNMFPFNTVRIVGGNVDSVEKAIEYAYMGYDGVVLGRAITELPDIKKYIDDVHYFKGHLNMAKAQQIPEGYSLDFGNGEGQGGSI